MAGYQYASQPNLEDQAGPSAQSGGSGRVKLLTGSDQSETYIEVSMRGRTFPAMLDTGCSLSVCPYSMCKVAKIIPVQTELFAANETPIKVLGLTRVYFEINGMPSHADMLVTDDIQEFLLGFNYLKENNCEWLFTQNRIIINGHSVPLRSRPGKGAVRRIYVKESVVIPADTAVNVPVKLPLQNLRTAKSDWLSEVRRIRPGLLAARTLLPHSSQYFAITFLNMSGKEQALRPGLQLGVATAVPEGLARPFTSEVGACGDEVRSKQSEPRDASFDVSRGRQGNPTGEPAGLYDTRLAVSPGPFSPAVLPDTPSAESVDTPADADNAHCLMAPGPDGRETLSAVTLGGRGNGDLAGPFDLAGRVDMSFSGPGCEPAGRCGTPGESCNVCSAGPHTVDPDEMSPVDTDVTELKACMAGSGVSSMDVLASSLCCNRADVERACLTNNDVSLADGVASSVVVNSVSSSGVDASVLERIEDYAHVQPVIDGLPSILTPEQRERVVTLIKKNSDIFSTHEFDVGCTHLLTASIETGGHPPIAEPLRRHARVHLDVIDETIEKMERAGIVEPCCSEWAANLVVVPKRDSEGRPVTPRITIDFRKLNAITYKDRYPIPNTKDCLQSLNNVAFLSSIDLANSFFQVPIREQDRDKTAFITRKGQYRLTRLAMGCCNSPSTFSRLMSLVVQGLRCCLAFIDDTIVFSSSFSQHLIDVQLLFDRFRAANLKLKPTKCKLFQTECEFLGHHISSDGIAVQESKVACIQSWPFPQNVTELRAFLGICGYYRAYVRSFATIAEPLTQCLRRDIPLEETPERRNAFNRLKRALSEAPVLAVPRDDLECTYVIDSDASSYAAGAVCQQWQDGKL